MSVQLKQDAVLEVLHEKLGPAKLEQLTQDDVDAIVESCFTRLGGSGLVRWVQCNDSGEAPLPGHNPFSAALIDREDLDAGRRIIARTIEAFA